MAVMFTNLRKRSHRKVKVGENKYSHFIPHGTYSICQNNCKSFFLSVGTGQQITAFEKIEKEIELSAHHERAHAHDELLSFLELSRTCYLQAFVVLDFYRKPLA